MERGRGGPVERAMTSPGSIRRISASARSIRRSGPSTRLRSSPDGIPPFSSQPPSGISFFSKAGGGNKIGMKVVDERITISSDPLDPEAYANTFANDGQPISKTAWIENGVVKNLPYDRYWAQKQGKTPMPTSGTVRMSGGTATLDDLIASTERGVLVTRFWS